MSEKASNSTRSRGIGFTGLLTIAFIVLKLCNVITWTWVWVLAPVWISLVIILLVCIIIAVLQLKEES